MKKWCGLSTLIPLALFTVSCDSDPPVDDGILWRCFADVEAKDHKYIIFGGSSGKASYRFSVCANPGVAPSDVLAECEQECEDHFSGIGNIFVQAGCDTGGDCTPSDGEFVYTSATCTITSGPDPNPSRRCDEADELIDVSGGSSEVITSPLNQSQSGLTLTIEDEVGSTTLSGTVGYMIIKPTAGCPVDGCEMFFSSFNLTGADFEIDDVPITDLSASSTGLVPGKWFPDGTVFIESADFPVQTNFHIDGVQGSFRAFPDQDVVGVIDPDADIFQFLSIMVTGPDDATISIDLNAELIARPPTAIIADTSPVTECNTIGAALVSLDASQSSDPDGDLWDFVWHVERNGLKTFLSDQVNPSVMLPLGTSTIVLSAFDQRGWPGGNAYTTSVVDTVNPSASCEDFEAECSGASTPVTVSCSGSDVCDANVDLTTDAFSSYPLGTHPFNCMAQDDSNNVDSASCVIRILDSTPPVITPSPSSNLSECNPDPHVVSLPLPTLTDTCGQGNPVLSGMLIAVNGKPVTPAVPVPVDGRLPLRQGTAMVRWQATDSSGNSVSLDQLFTINLVQGTSCCKPGQTISQGTGGQDSIVKTSGSHCVFGQGGGDFVQTAGGNDLLFGQDGADNLTGGGGVDVLYGGAAADMVSCGYGGTYEAHGQAGDDQVQAVYCSSAEIWGGSGSDNLTGSPGADKLYPGPGIDSLGAGSGNDLVTLYHACEAVGGKSLSGGSGQDTLVTPLSVSALQAQGVTVTGFETVIINTSQGYLSECF